MYKAAICFEGGAMRGVYTSGIIDGLLTHGIEIENVYGISAGAKNSQYYISKQIGEGIKVDLFCARNKHAIGVKNFILHGGVINREYYDSYIMKYYAPIDEEAFYNSKQKYYIGATNCITGEIHYFEKSSCDLRKAIGASCSVPLVQSMVRIDGIPYLDGGIGENIPYKTAMKDGNEKIVLVLTQPKGYRANNKFEKAHKVYRFHYRKYPELIEKMLTNDERYDAMLDEIDKLEEEGKVFVIRPSVSLGISMLEHEEEQLTFGYNLGRNDLESILEDLLLYLNK